MLLKSTAAVLLLSLVLVRPLAANAEDLRYRILHFAETASREVPNDWVRVRLVLESRHADAARAAAETTRKFNAVQARVRGLQGVAAELESRSAYPESAAIGQRRVWIDRAVVGVSSDDFRAVAGLLADSSGEAYIGGVAFSLKAETRRRTVEALSLEALDGFRHRAQVLSRAMGGSAYRVVEVRLREDFDGGGAYTGGMPAMMRAAAADTVQAETAFDSPGLTRVRQTAEGTVQY